MATDSPQAGRQARQIWGHTTQPSNLPMLCHKGNLLRDRSIQARARMNIIISEGVRMVSRNSVVPVLWRVDQYDGQKSVGVAATQLDHLGVGAVERRKILAEWIEFLANVPTNIQHLDLVSRVPQELLDAVAGQSGLRSIDVKWGPYHDLVPLSELRQLEQVSLGGAGRLTSLSPLSSLPALSALTVSQAHNVDDITTLSELKSLRALLFGNASLGSDKSVVMADLSWVTPLARLTTLELPGTRILSANLTPILALENLVTLGLPLRRSYRKQVFELAGRSAVFAKLAAEYEGFEAMKSDWAEGRARSERL